MNNGLLQEHRLGRMIEVRTGPTFPDALRAYTQDLSELRACNSQNYRPVHAR